MKGTSYLKRNHKVLETLDEGEITRSMTLNEDNMIAKDNDNYVFLESTAMKSSGYENITKTELFWAIGISLQAGT